MIGRASANGPDVPPRSARASTAIAGAVPSDIDAVATIEAAAFADPWSRQAFEAALRERHARFRVARSPEGVIGYVIAWFIMDEGEIANLAVAPSARRRGVAIALLDVVIDDARASGLSRLFLEVRESNAAARALYAARGFKPVARRTRYYRKPVEDAIVLRLEL
ncbi:MAG: ribosomal protein S18-alanine N-acetyltransferase [Gemmatimonadaceae bacterium]